MAEGGVSVPVARLEPSSKSSDQVSRPSLESGSRDADPSNTTAKGATPAGGRVGDTPTGGGVMGKATVADGDRMRGHLEDGRPVGDRAPVKRSAVRVEALVPDLAGRRCIVGMERQRDLTDVGRRPLLLPDAVDAAEGIRHDV